MLRVVADANVLISAAISRSPQAPSVLTLDAALDRASSSDGSTPKWREQLQRRGD